MKKLLLCAVLAVTCIVPYDIFAGVQVRVQDGEQQTTPNAPTNNETVEFCKDAYVDQQHFYFGAKEGMDKPANEPYALTRASLDQRGLRLRPLAPAEKTTQVNTAGALAVSPLLGKKISQLALVGNGRPVAHVHTATPANDATLFLVDDVDTGERVLTNQTANIGAVKPLKDAANAPAVRIHALAGTGKEVTYNAGGDKANFIFAAVSDKDNWGEATNASRGIATVSVEGDRLAVRKAAELTTQDHAAVQLKLAANKHVAVGHAATLEKNAKVDMHWDDYYQHLYLTQSQLKSANAQHDTAVGVAIGKFDATGADGVFELKPFVTLNHDRFNQADKNAQEAGVFGVATDATPNQGVVNLSRPRTLHTSTNNHYLLATGGVEASGDGLAVTTWVNALPLVNKNVGGKEPGTIAHAADFNDELPAFNVAKTPHIDRTTTPANIAEYAVGNDTKESTLKVSVGAHPGYMTDLGKYTVAADMTLPDNKFPAGGYHPGFRSVIKKDSKLVEGVKIGEGTTLQDALILPEHLKIPGGTVVPDNFELERGDMLPAGMVLQRDTEITAGGADLKIPNGSVFATPNVYANDQTVADAFQAGWTLGQATVLQPDQVLPADTQVVGDVSLPFAAGVSVNANQKLQKTTKLNLVKFAGDNTEFGPDTVVGGGSVLTAGATVEHFAPQTRPVVLRPGTVIPAGFTFPAGAVLETGQCPMLAAALESAERWRKSNTQHLNNTYNDTLWVASNYLAAFIKGLPTQGIQELVAHKLDDLVHHAKSTGNNRIHTALDVGNNYPATLNAGEPVSAAIALSVAGQAGGGIAAAVGGLFAALVGHGGTPAGLGGAEAELSRDLLLGDSGGGVSRRDLWPVDIAKDLEVGGVVAAAKAMMVHIMQQHLRNRQAGAVGGGEDYDHNIFIHHVLDRQSTLGKLKIDFIAPLAISVAWQDVANDPTDYVYAMSLIAKAAGNRSVTRIAPYVVAAEQWLAPQLGAGGRADVDEGATRRAIANYCTMLIRYAAGATGNAGNANIDAAKAAELTAVVHEVAKAEDIALGVTPDTVTAGLNALHVGDELDENGAVTGAVYTLFDNFAPAHVTDNYVAKLAEYLQNHDEKAVVAALTFMGCMNKLALQNQRDQLFSVMGLCARDHIAVLPKIATIAMLLRCSLTHTTIGAGAGGAQGTVDYKNRKRLLLPFARHMAMAALSVNAADQHTVHLGGTSLFTQPAFGPNNNNFNENRPRFDLFPTQGNGGLRPSYDGTRAVGGLQPGNHPVGVDQNTYKASDGSHVLSAGATVVLPREYVAGDWLPAGLKFPAGTNAVVNAAAAGAVLLPNKAAVAIPNDGADHDIADEVIDNGFVQVPEHMTIRLPENFVAQEFAVPAAGANVHENALFQKYGTWPLSPGTSLKVADKGFVHMKENSVLAPGSRLTGMSVVPADIGAAALRWFAGDIGGNHVAIEAQIVNDVAKAPHDVKLAAWNLDGAALAATVRATIQPTDVTKQQLVDRAIERTANNLFVKMTGVTPIDKDLILQGPFKIDADMVLPERTFVYSAQNAEDKRLPANNVVFDFAAAANHAVATSDWEQVVPDGQTRKLAAQLNVPERVFIKFPAGQAIVDDNGGGAQGDKFIRFNDESSVMLDAQGSLKVTDAKGAIFAPEGSVFAPGSVLAEHSMFDRVLVQGDDLMLQEGFKFPYWHRFDNAMYVKNFSAGDIHLGGLAAHSARGKLTFYSKAFPHDPAVWSNNAAGYGVDKAASVVIEALRQKEQVTGVAAAAQHNLNQNDIDALLQKLSDKPASTVNELEAVLNGHGGTLDDAANHAKRVELRTAFATAAHGALISGGQAFAANKIERGWTIDADVVVKLANDAALATNRRRLNDKFVVGAKPVELAPAGSIALKNPGGKLKVKADSVIANTELQAEVEIQNDVMTTEDNNLFSYFSDDARSAIIKQKPADPVAFKSPAGMEVPFKLPSTMTVPAGHMTLRGGTRFQGDSTIKDGEKFKVESHGNAAATLTLGGALTLDQTHKVKVQNNTAVPAGQHLTLGRDWGVGHGDIVLGADMVLPNNFDYTAAPLVDHRWVLNQDLTLGTGGGELVDGTLLKKDSELFMHGDINICDMQVVGDHVLVALEEDRQAGNGNEAGTFVTKPLYARDGKVRAWMPWQRVAGHHDATCRIGFDARTGNYMYLTTHDGEKPGKDGRRANTIKATTWNAESGLSVRSRQAIETHGDNDGVNNIVYFDEDTAGFKAFTRGAETPHFSMAVVTGNKWVMLAQTGQRANAGGAYDADGVNFDHITNFDDANSFIFPRRGVADEETAFEELGDIWCAELARIADAANEGWLFVGGQHGVAVLSNAAGQGFNSDIGGGYGLARFEDAGTDAHYPAGANWQFRKLNLTGIDFDQDENAVRKLVADPVGKHLYILTAKHLYRVKMDAANFRGAAVAQGDAGWRKLASTGAAAGSSTSDGGVGYILPDPEDYFTDMLITYVEDAGAHDLVMLQILLASSKGLFVNNLINVGSRFPHDFDDANLTAAHWQRVAYKTDANLAAVAGGAGLKSLQQTARLDFYNRLRGGKMVAGAHNKHYADGNIYALGVVLDNNNPAAVNAGSFGVCRLDVGPDAAGLAQIGLFKENFTESETKAAARAGANEMVDAKRTDYYFKYGQIGPDADDYKAVVFKGPATFRLVEGQDNTEAYPVASLPDAQYVQRARLSVDKLVGENADLVDADPRAYIDYQYPITAPFLNTIPWRTTQIDSASGLASMHGAFGVLVND